MIKLESTSSGLSALSTIAIQSASGEPSIALSTEKYRAQVNGQWQDDSTRMKQHLAFLAEDGPCELSGIVQEAQAVEIAAAWKVVLEVRLSTKALPAFQAGRVSKAVVALEVVRVIEVWASPTKKLWAAADQPKPGRTFDAGTGKVAAA